MQLPPIPPEENSGNHRESTWHPINLAAFLTGDQTEDKPSMLRRNDGVALIYRGRIHSLYGEPEGLKTWVALEACRQELTAGNNVVYIDFEDSVRGIISRLRALGISDEVIATRFVYIRPAERLTPEDWDELTDILTKSALVVMDGFTEAMVLEGLNLLDNSDVATFYEKQPRPAARLGPAVLINDHVGRNKETRGRFAIGAQAKLAGIDGAAYSITVIKPFGRGKTGQADIRLAKDRLGFVSEHVEDEHRTIATVVAVSDFETVTVTLEPPGEFVPTILMQRVSETLQAQPGMSQKQIRDTVSGNTDWKLKALHQLVARGYVSTEPGPRGAIQHTLIHPYRDGDQLRPYQNDDLSRPVPDLSPGQVKVSPRPVPPHSKGTGRGLSEDMTFTEETEDRSNSALCATCGKPGADASYLGELVHNTNRCLPGGRVDFEDGRAWVDATDEQLTSFGSRR
jgi:hypothetical protein